MRSNIEKVLSKEERIQILEKQKVLSGRLFKPEAREKLRIRDLVDGLVI